MKHIQDYIGLPHAVDSMKFWSKEDHQSYDNDSSCAAAWLDKEDKVYRWCEENPSQGRFSFCASSGIFYFEHEQDFLLVVLRWS